MSCSGVLHLACGYLGSCHEFMAQRYLNVKCAEVKGISERTKDQAEPRLF